MEFKGTKFVRNGCLETHDKNDETMDSGTNGSIKLKDGKIIWNDTRKVAVIVQIVTLSNHEIRNQENTGTEFLFVFSIRNYVTDVN